ncbi:hypothetical protein CCH79_00005965 [Gambusia affinis]|uniref:Uncharacterized protein n=1 Tax=Gambusia affinis TaxID=33528 RepID=A0A315VJN1_GAMAF|nr:hypothetical protein CCH79_00005965 [Gambusia affinis]
MTAQSAAVMVAV